MVSRLLGVLWVVLAIARPAQAIVVEVELRRIDVENRVAVVFANGQERTLKVADDAKILDENGKQLRDGLAAKELKAKAIATLQVEPVGKVIQSLRLGGRNSSQNSNKPARLSIGKSSVGFKPLNEMTAEDRYQGEDGGLYGGGRNEAPEVLLAAAKKETVKIVPRDAQGNPAADGQIGLVSISMSNATQEFSKFKQLADADLQKSPSVTIVDCAQGGQTMARWADPQAACWDEADRRLQSAGVAREQVQVVWVKLANAGPNGELKMHGQELARDTRIVLANLSQHFPNLRIAYLGSRIYGGYADGRLNPEPYAYESAFVVRWLILSQMKGGESGLNYDETRGKVQSPLLLWGPYFWSDGIIPRKSDGQVWERSDLAADGTHPSDSGRRKVAAQLLNFFKSDALAQTWFVKQ